MGLLPLDPSIVGQMCKVGCCLVVDSCCESRAFLCIRGLSPRIQRTRFSARPPMQRRRGHVPGCLLRKGGDVPGKEVSGAYERLTSLPFEAGSFALPAIEPRFAGSRAVPQAAR
ncbi:hypothetical protein JOD82_005891 [Paenibacillus sp. 1182]|uniref:hypothetical protein n=1 Tax=Paenibacillus sp. 1182 TaxID=2806565 RepID=UPI000FAD4510|nr:hypothetical protein [Paenibacillus sp. 1182]MBP1312737.1 hypothetical protein [Paenibacillus sp. 1182]